MTTYIFYYALKVLAIGTLDLLEYAFFNPHVYTIHNFPDIVPNMKPGYLAAFISGAKCALQYFRGTNPLISTGVAFFASLMSMLYIDVKDDPYKYHKYFYLFFGLAELYSMIW